MGGPKETLVDGDGQTLLDLQVKRMTPHFQEIVLLNGRQIKAVDHLDSSALRQVCDPQGYLGEGPLAGLCAALRVCRSDWIALLPIDLPYFPPEALLGAVGRAPEDSLAVGFLDEQDGPHWLPGLFSCRLQSAVEIALAGGERSLSRLVSSVQHTYLPCQEDLVRAPEAFFNLNTPEQAIAAGFRLPSVF